MNGGGGRAAGNLHAHRGNVKAPDSDLTLAHVPEWVLSQTLLLRINRIRYCIPALSSRTIRNRSTLLGLPEICRS